MTERAVTPGIGGISTVLPGLPGYWAHLDNSRSPGSWVRPIVGWAVLLDGSVTPLLQEPDGRVTLFSELKKDADVTAHVHNVVLGTECPWGRDE